MFPLDRVTVHAGDLFTIGDHGWFGPLGQGIRSGSPDPHLGAVGLALGSAMAAWTELVLLTRRTRRVLGVTSGPASVMGLLASPVAAAVVTAVGVHWLTDSLPDVATALISLAAAGTVYVSVAAAIGVSEAHELLGALRGATRRLLGR
jgi:peptidoglycan biosynthesis protein MviN/MurJ (putative lipid II flippase)